MENEFLTVAEVAQRFRTSKMTIYRLVNNGELRSVRVGSGIRIPTAVVDEFLAAQLGGSS